MAGLDASTSGEIFRRDFKPIIAQNRHLASIIGARVQYDSLGYSAGQVMARNSTSGLYTKYSNGGASGTGTAVGVLFADVKDMATNQPDIGQIIVSGQLLEANIVGLDSTVRTNLGSRSVINGNGTTIFIF